MLSWFDATCFIHGLWCFRLKHGCMADDIFEQDKGSRTTLIKSLASRIPANYVGPSPFEGQQDLLAVAKAASIGSSTINQGPGQGTPGRRGASVNPSSSFQSLFARLEPILARPSDSFSLWTGKWQPFRLDSTRFIGQHYEPFWSVFLLWPWQQTHQMMMMIKKTLWLLTTLWFWDVLINA